VGGEATNRRNRFQVERENRKNRLISPQTRAEGPSSCGLFAGCYDNIDSELTPSETTLSLPFQPVHRNPPKDLSTRPFFLQFNPLSFYPLPV